MSLYDEIFEVMSNRNVGKKVQLLEVEYLKEFLQEEYKLLVLAKRGEISWQDFAKKREELIGKELVE